MQVGLTSEFNSDPQSPELYPTENTISIIVISRTV